MVVKIDPAGYAGVFADPDPRANGAGRRIFGVLIGDVF